MQLTPIIDYAMLSKSPVHHFSGNNVRLHFPTYPFYIFRGDGGNDWASQLAAQPCEEAFQEALEGICANCFTDRTRNRLR